MNPTNLKKFIFLFVWFFLTAALIGSLHAAHLVQWRADESLIAPNDSNLWSVHHVLSADCKCSQTIAQYLLNRGPKAETFESVTWIGAPNEISEKLQERGYQVRIATFESVQKDLPVGVPFFSVKSPEQKVVYTGGYASSQIQKDTPLKDLEILAQSRQGQGPNLASLPIFGCTVSQKFQKQLDPFLLKYRRAGL